MSDSLSVEFVGERYHPDPGRPFWIGRAGDLVLDAENPFLHRRFLKLSRVDHLWWLANVGTQLTATVADEAGAMQAWLAPGAALPLVFRRAVVWFTAGATTYEFEVQQELAHFEPTPVQPVVGGSPTVGRLALTPAQKLLVVALSEDALRHGGHGRSAIPTSAAAAQRIGWTLTRFNRKLDNVCDRLTAMGVRGLHGDARRLATQRKARLVEYALATRLVVVDDLALLDAGTDATDPS